MELSCNSATATANGLGADGFHGKGPVVIEFTRTAEQPQLSCRAGLEEYHMEENLLNDAIDIDVSYSKKMSESQTKAGNQEKLKKN